MEAVLPDAQPRKARASRVCRMKELRMQPNTKTHTVLPISGRIQGITGKWEIGSDEKISQPFGVCKKITARSGWDDQIRVFLHPCMDNKTLLRVK